MAPDQSIAAEQHDLKVDQARIPDRGVPPKRGRAILPIIGSTENNRIAPRKDVRPKRIGVADFMSRISVIASRSAGSCNVIRGASPGSGPGRSREARIGPCRYNAIFRCRASGVGFSLAPACSWKIRGFSLPSIHRRISSRLRFREYLKDFRSGSKTAVDLATGARRVGPQAPLARAIVPRAVPPVDRPSAARSPWPWPVYRWRRS